MRVIAELQALCPVCNGAPSPLSLYLCEADHEGRGSLVQCALCAMPTTEWYACMSCSTVTSSISAAKTNATCEKCMECPVCRTRLHVVGSDNRFTYTCPYCAWEPASLCEATPSALLDRCRSLQDEKDTDHIGRIARIVRHHRDGTPFASDEGKGGGNAASVSDVVAAWKANERNELLSSSARWADPMRQPHRATDLIPLRGRLVPRPTLLCRTCRRFLVKPEIDCRSASFKVNALATSVMPKVKVLQDSERVCLELSNVAPYVCSIHAGPHQVQCGPYFRRRRRSSLNPSEAADESVVTIDVESSLGLRGEAKDDLVTVSIQLGIEFLDSPIRPFRVLMASTISAFACDCNDLAWLHR
ncbi:Dynactin subunit 4 [Plasmodiophora brassicae]|uniref:Dynactin subunit 4 n=1 Tax=Plasmodiophora brassicae TaxID=37360 RepID=A0A0G4IMQ4_PLABS|nr:hypothetical protein PBRA_005053 [Plasmodiophora brassicae]SPQ99323.1 unnamed protein product [Plasmodiophora brassicae]